MLVVGVLFVSVHKVKRIILTSLCDVFFSAQTFGSVDCFMASRKSTCHLPGLASIVVLSPQNYLPECGKATVASRRQLRGHYLLEDGARVHWTPERRQRVVYVPVCSKRKQRYSGFSTFRQVILRRARLIIFADFTPFSPDVLCIENVWSLVMKEAACQRYCSGEASWQAVRHAWCEFSGGHIGQHAQAPCSGGGPPKSPP